MYGSLPDIDERKIAIIIYKRNEEDYQRLLAQVRAFEIPPIDGGGETRIDIVSVADAENRAAAYNAAMEKSAARYKVYLDTDIRTLNPRLLQVVIKAFESLETAGMIGTFGSSLPLDGDFRHAKQKYGICVWHNDETDGNQWMLGDAGVCYQRVDALDGLCVATRADVPWDEEVDDAFLATSHACALRAAHYGTYVLTLSKRDPMIVAAHPSPYFYTPDAAAFEAARQQFAARYGAQRLPLVSILIPSYNQPEFCRQALESALRQTYPNIEILIGDDSTDSRVREALAPLIEQHENVQYFYRGDLREGTARNIRFLLGASHGAFVNLLFHDDIIYPTKIEKMMAYFIEDVNDDIAFATSRRDFIDAQGQSKGEIQGYSGAQNTMMTGWQLCRNILRCQMNVVGEMSTVLLRRSLLGEGGSRSGTFCGYRDLSMGDTSTWLELLKDGRACLFLDEELSAFRDHPAQNTHHPETFLLTYLDWMNFLVLAYLHKLYLPTQRDFREGCACWAKQFGPRRAYLEKNVDPAKRPQLAIYEQELEAVAARDDDRLIELSIRYMASTGSDPAVFLAGTEWQERAL